MSTWRRWLRTSGFLVNDTWEDEGRYFAQLERIADP